MNNRNRTSSSIFSERNDRAENYLNSTKVRIIINNKNIFYLKKMKPELESKLNSYLKLEKEISREVSKHINGFISPNSLIERIVKIDGDKILLVKKSQEEIKQNLSLEEELSLKIEIENRLIKNSQKYRIIQISQHIAQVIFILSGIAVFITLENTVLFFIAIASILYAVGSHYYLGHIDEINSMYDELIGRKNE